MIKYTDISYGSHERQKFDLFLPRDYKGNGIVLFIHGGAWLAGDKNGCRSHMEKAAEAGYAAAAINYHYISDETHMDMLMNDVHKAVASIKNKAAEAGVNLTKMLVTGVSAGGHMSLLYSYMHKDDAAIKPVCVIDFCGPADLVDEGMVFGNVIGDSEVMIGIMNKLTGMKCTPETANHAMALLRKYSPVYYVTPDTPPTVICHGQMDMAVPFVEAVHLRDELEKKYVEYAFIPMPHAGHSLDEIGPQSTVKAVCSAWAERFLK